MNVHIEIGGHKYSMDPQPISIAIPVHFNGLQPNTYGVPKARSEAYAEDGWVGDVRQGGSCNFETLEMTPHCNGTHTECVGHITRERVHLPDFLSGQLIPATVISVSAEVASATSDHYDPNLREDDLVISRAVLNRGLPNPDLAFLKALVIRTLPNDHEKKGRDYMQIAPPFFSLEGMQQIRAWGVEHLVVDIPSVDRLFDEGKLSTHHIFWDLPAGSHDLPDQKAMGRTITEMAFIPDEIEDAPYLLDIQIPAFLADAAPSRPLLYRLDP